METMSSKQEQRLHGEHELQMSKTEKSEQNDREIAVFLTKYGDLWQAAPFKITMISPVFSRVSATFGNLFPRWRSVLFNGHCATQKDIA